MFLHSILAPTSVNLREKSLIYEKKTRYV
jgi:hypothetical protein